MTLHFVPLKVSPLLRCLRSSVLLPLLGFCWCIPASYAKQPSLTVIELYDGPNGAAYLQIENALINGKPVFRDCTPYQSAAIDKSTYGRMQKVEPVAGAVLERDNSGVLRYGIGEGQPQCVVPDNVKFGHDEQYSLSDLADQATLTGISTGLASAGLSVPPPLKRGVKLVFVAAWDSELAEFLRAQRAADVDGWLRYLSMYPASPHVAYVKFSLAMLYVKAGEALLDNYQRSVTTASPSYSDLKDAKVQADKARSIMPALEQTVKLSGKIREDLAAIAEEGQGELNKYNTALQSRAPGYFHLLSARKLSDILAGIDLDSPGGKELLEDTMKAANDFDRALRSAESAVADNQMDTALEIVTPLRGFSSEEPRIEAVVDSVYGYDLQLGKQFADAGNWDSAVKEWEKTANVKDTPEVRDALTDARKQLVIAQDKALAAKALGSSKELEQQHDNIGAFELLYNLPSSQKAYVNDDIERLKSSYIQDAVKAAKELQKAHDPIRGLGDEIGIEKAYDYLQRAYELNDDVSLSDTMTILGDDLSTYFVAQAKRYLDKPSGSGTELGWNYLEEALFYKPSNQSAHDAKVAATPAHAMHSKISIRVQFRDQTSLRDSTGFIHQLEDAIITGLEVPTIKAIRFGETANGVEPDFQLVGDVLEHQITETATLDSMESNYRFGTHDDPNDEWNKANRAYDAALRTLQMDQSAIQGAEAKGNKKDISELNAKIEVDQKQISEAQRLADSLPKTVTRDIIRPYHYTRKTIDIKNTIRLQFRLGETLNGQMDDAVLVDKSDPRQFILLEDVKPDDTEGVKLAGTTPNSKEMQTALENAIRDELIAAVQLKVKELPLRIYNEAKSKEQEENVDGAAEEYLRFLSCTVEDGSAERQHAKSFLAQQFNMRPEASSSQ